MFPQKCCETNKLFLTSLTTFCFLAPESKQTSLKKKHDFKWSIIKKGGNNRLSCIINWTLIPSLYPRILLL